MVVDHEAGLTAPVFTPMSYDLPHMSEPGETYHAAGDNLRDNKDHPENPDLYGPPTAIFSA